jgi:hypothetical protein
VPKTYDGKKTATSKNVAGKTGYIDTCLSPSVNTNSKWIKDLNIRPKTLKLVQERAGNTVEAIGIGKDFLSGTQVAQEL